MKNIYVDIVYNEECEHSNDRYSYESVEADMIVVTTHDEEVINDPESFMDFIVESLKSNSVIEEDVVAHIREGELFKIIPSDPSIDNIEKVMDMQERFDRTRPI